MPCVQLRRRHHVLATVRRLAMRSGRAFLSSSVRCPQRFTCGILDDISRLLQAHNDHNQYSEVANMLSEIRAFSVFAEVGSVQGTASRLHLTQSAVTRQIKRLEQQLDTLLLDRRFKPPILTSTGLNVLERCRSILREFGELKATASPVTEPAGKLRVGVGYVLADDEFIDCVHNVTARFPKVVLQIRTD